MQQEWASESAVVRASTCHGLATVRHTVLHYLLVHYRLKHRCMVNPPAHCPIVQPTVLWKHLVNHCNELYGHHPTHRRMASHRVAPSCHGRNDQRAQHTPSMPPTQITIIIKFNRNKIFLTRESSVSSSIYTASIKRQEEKGVVTYMCIQVMMAYGRVGEVGQASGGQSM